MNWWLNLRSNFPPMLNSVFVEITRYDSDRNWRYPNSETKKKQVYRWKPTDGFGPLYDSQIITNIFHSQTTIIDFLFSLTFQLQTISYTYILIIIFKMSNRTKNIWFENQETYTLIHSSQNSCKKQQTQTKLKY